MIGHIHFTNKKQNISATTTSERYIVYYIVLYLFAVVVVVAGTVVVLPIILLQSEEVAAGPGSVYIPGAGFAGFWYHFGYFTQQHHPLGYETLQRKNHSQTDRNIHHEMVKKNNSTYYCYSSGCLGYVLAAASVDIETVLTAAQRVQKLWLEGQIHRYDVVPNFLQEVLPPAIEASFSNFIQKNRTLHSSPSSTSQWNSILSQLRIIVTVMEPSSLLNNRIMRHRIHSPTAYSTLIHYLQQTTHIPWLTGPITTDGTNEVIIDGGFSRISHPVCSKQIVVPATWSTMIHSLNPGLDPKVAKELFFRGMTDANHRYSQQESPTSYFDYAILESDKSW